MKGNYKRVSEAKRQLYSSTYNMNHVLFDNCTLYKSGELGLAVIQQRFNKTMKVSWWGPIDPWLANDIYEQPYFREFFFKRAREVADGFYPVIEVRKLMYALHMKPMKRELWETDLEAYKVPYLM